MTLEAQNMAIAEVCGWVWYRLPEKPWKDARRYRCLFLPAVHEYDGQSPEWLVRSDGTETICNWQYMQREGGVPNYTGSLDAMHSVVRPLSGEEFDAYVNILVSLCGSRNAYRATSEVCAEAFIKSKGLWKRYGDEHQENLPM